MDNPQQPYAPILPQHVPPSKKNSNNLKMILVVLAAVTVILLVMLLVFANRAFVNDKKINDANLAGQAAGETSQKAKDDKAAADLAVSVTRTYVAPDFVGNFSIQVPKSWSLAVSPDSTSGTIDGYSAPDSVDMKLTRFPLLFSLKNQNLDATRSQYDSLYSDKKVKREDTAVSGIKGVKYTGALSDQIPSGTAILIPIREKTFIIETDDNAKYLSAFNTIVGNVKLNP